MPGNNIQPSPELMELWEQSKIALMNALKKGYDETQDGDNIYVPEWLVNISDILVTAQSKGDLKREEEVVSDDN